jgi:carbon monoxide dehydrogenase subunit G
MVIEISESLDVKAPLEDVWRVISDLDHEHELWPGLKDPKILKKTGNSLEREVKIRRGPMGEAKSVQELALDSGNHGTILTMNSGPMLGTRRVSLSKSGDGLTKISVDWKFEMKGVPTFALGFVKENIAHTTEEALAAIADRAKKKTP